VGDECVSACLESALPFYFCERRVVRRASNLHDVAWPTSAYATSDGWVGITAGRFDDVRQLLALLHLDDLLPAGASSFEEIIPSVAVLNATLASALRRWPTAKLVTSCQEAGLAAAPALWPADLLTDEQLLARGLVEEGSRRLTHFPALFRGEPAGSARPARRALRADGVTLQRAAKESVRPLAGIRVVDLTWALAGPIATMVLADLGADVVKLESRNHVDSSRLVGPYNGPHDIDHSGYHRFFNRGKRSIECDFRSEQSRKMLLDLVGLSDVLVENFRAGSLDAKGLGYNALLRQRQGLVMCSLSGFGRTGPRASWRSYGAGMAETHSGLAAAMGGERPIVPGRSYADFIAGLYAALCVCAQLYHRRVRCRSSYSDVAQFDTCAATVFDLAVLGPEPAEAHHIEPGGHGRWTAVGDTASFLVEDIENVARRGLASGFLAPFRRAEGEVDVYARFPGLLDGERLEITRPGPFLGESPGPDILESWAESAESAR
jgi:crotonobetainyl-CoA:carnitine CoA-transferase CaiB-like acyl-CoA transferase